MKGQQESTIKIWDRGKEIFCKEIKTQQIKVPSKWTIEELMWDALYETARWLPHSPPRRRDRPVKRVMLASARRELLKMWCSEFGRIWPSRIHHQSFILSDMAVARHQLFKSNKPFPKFGNRDYIEIQEIYGHDRRVAELRVKGLYWGAAEYSSLLVYSYSGTIYCNLNASKQH